MGITMKASSSGKTCSRKGRGKNNREAFILQWSVHKPLEFNTPAILVEKALRERQRTPKFTQLPHGWNVRVQQTTKSQKGIPLSIFIFILRIVQLFLGPDSWRHIYIYILFVFSSYWSPGNFSGKRRKTRVITNAASGGKSHSRWIPAI